MNKLKLYLVAAVPVLNVAFRFRSVKLIAEEAAYTACPRQATYAMIMYSILNEPENQPSILPTGE